MLVDVSPWEVPLYRDGLWPCTELVTFDDNSSMTPISPLDAALKFVHAINWLTTLTMGKARTTMRLLMATVNQNGDGLDSDAKMRAMIGQDLEAIHINALGESHHINEFIQQFKWDNSWVDSSLRLIQFMQQKFDDLSGITQIMRSGEPDTQDRSAEATRLRRETSFNRADDMRQSVMNMHDEVARKEATYLQFLKDGEYIGNIFGQKAGMEFGYLGTREDQDPMSWMRKLTAQGADPQIAAVQAQSRALRAYTVDDIMHEATYKTYVGDGPRHDRAAKIEAMNSFFNQMGPTLAQTGNPKDMAIVYRNQAAYYDEIGMEQELILQLRARADELEAMADQPQPAPEAPANEGQNQVP
jgi:hypothetical protein